MLLNYNHPCRYNDVLMPVAPIPLIAAAQQQPDEQPGDNVVTILTLLQMNPDNLMVNNQNNMTKKIYTIR